MIRVKVPATHTWLMETFEPKGSRPLQLGYFIPFNPCIGGIRRFIEAFPSGHTLVHPSESWARQAKKLMVSDFVWLLSNVTTFNRGWSTDAEEIFEKAMGGDYYILGKNNSTSFKAAWVFAAIYVEYGDSSLARQVIGR